MESRKLAAAAARIADAKKGEDVRVYDVSEQIKIADFFVIVTGTSRPHVKAIQNELHVLLKELGEQHARAEGTELGWWVLLDYGDVVIHVFDEETRAYYDLERLWGNAPRLERLWGNAPRLEFEPAPSTA